MNLHNAAVLLDRRKQRLDWAKIHQPAGIAQLIDKNTGEIVAEEYMPNLQDMNRELSLLFSRENLLV